jgi:hypothetical protein
MRDVKRRGAPLNGREMLRLAAVRPLPSPLLLELLTTAANVYTIPI